MRPLVVEAGLAALLPPRAHPVVVVPRRRRRRRWRAIDADAALRAVESVGAHAVAAARRPAADPGAACLGAVARLHGIPLVRLPDDPERAAWALVVALEGAAGDERPLRRLEALASAAAGAGASFADRLGPPLRPGVLARWAGRAWRPCAACLGGGLPGAPCGRCGAPLAEEGR